MGAPALFDRKGEMAQLQAALGGAVEHGGAILITGAPGIGKSSLLEAAATEARTRGYQVLTVTGLESEAQFPYGGLHQLLQTVLASADKLPVPQKDALRTALGAMSGAPPDTFLVGLATLNLIDEAAGGKPIVLLADDAQWLDSPTAAVLTFVARRLDSTGILLLVGLRDGFDSPLRTAHLPEIPVRPLDDDASRGLLDSVAPDLARHLREGILEEAVGNPLALVELPRAATEQTGQERQASRGTIPLTERLERTFSVQAARLPKHTRSALLVAALDDDPSVAEVMEATRIQAAIDVTVDLLDPALTAGLITIAGPNIRFRHPLIRSALGQVATPGSRRAAHLALAEVIEDPDRRAWHRAACVLGTDGEAAANLEAAAARAQERGAISTALAALEMAASLTPVGTLRARRLLAAAELAFQLGQPAAVGRLLDSAAKLPLTPNDVARMTWLREIFFDGVPGDATAIIRLATVAQEMAADGDRDLAFKLLQGAALRCWWADPGHAARDRVVRTVEQIAGEEDDPRALEILSLTAPVDLGERVATRVARAASTDVADALRTQMLGFAAYAAGDYGQALALLDRAADGLREQGRLGQLTRVLSTRAWGEIHLGRLSDANRDAEEAHRLATETAQPVYFRGSQIAMALLAGVRGQEALAERLALEAEAAVLPLRMGDLLSVVQLARGLTAMTAGRHADAYAHFARMFDARDVAFNELESYAAVGYLVGSAIQAGLRETAERQMPTLESLGKRTPAALLHAGLRYARALLADEAEAERLYEIALNAEPKWPFDHARLQMSYGSWLRRQRRIVESRPHLRAAWETFEALGVQPWADKARVELRASGERIAEPTSAPGQPLSPQELQIAQMAASGLTNREIADRLFLSHRTVGAHLYRVYPKLGIVSRAELAGILHSREPALAT